MVQSDFCQKIKISRCRWPGYCGIAHNINRFQSRYKVFVLLIHFHEGKIPSTTVGPHPILSGAVGGDLGRNVGGGGAEVGL